MPQAEKLPVPRSDMDELESWLRSGTTRKSWAERARIILLSAEGQSAEEIGEKLGLVRLTVYKWRQRYRESGVAGLKDLPRPGQPRKMTAAKAKEILDLTIHRVPKESTHWSLRLMAKYAKVSDWQVRQVWDAANLRPHRIKSFKISNNPHFSHKVVDVVGLYMDPPDTAVVLSLDEKTQIQALDRTQPMLQLRPGKIERRTHDYKRHGTTSLYAAFNIATGEVLGRVTQKHRAKEFIDFLAQVDKAHATGIDLHVILDNSSTHQTPEVLAWLSRHPRFHFHFTPTSASWLNAVEGWFSQLERRAVHRGVFTGVEALRVEIRRFIEAHNTHTAKPFTWTKSAASILDSVRRAKLSAGMRTTHAGH